MVMLASGYIEHSEQSKQATAALAAAVSVHDNSSDTYTINREQITSIVDVLHTKDEIDDEDVVLDQNKEEESVENSPTIPSYVISKPQRKFQGELDNLEEEEQEEDKEEEDTSSLLDNEDLVVEEENEEEVHVVPVEESSTRKTTMEKHSIVQKHLQESTPSCDSSKSMREQEDAALVCLLALSFCTPANKNTATTAPSSSSDTSKNNNNNNNSNALKGCSSKMSWYAQSCSTVLDDESSKSMTSSSTTTSTGTEETCTESQSLCPPPPTTTHARRRKSSFLNKDKKKTLLMDAISSGGGGVSFGSMQIREYGIALSDNPACEIGPPVQLDWEYNEKDVISLDEYEQQKRSSCYKKQQRKGSALILSHRVREKRLLRYGGYTEADIELVMKEVNRVKRERMMSEMLPLAGPIDEVLENISDVFKILLRRGGGVSTA